MTHQVLIVDDEVHMRWVLKESLTDFGYEVVTAESGAEALTILSHTPIDLIILDLKMRGMDGLGTLARIRERWPEVAIIILTAFGTVATAVEAMQLGAIDYLRKPFDVEEMGFKIQRALERTHLQAEVTHLRRTTALHTDTTLIGTHPAWLACRAQAAAPSLDPYDVWVLGEPGTGKRSLAHWMQRNSTRAHTVCLELDLRLFSAESHRDVVLGTPTVEGSWTAAGNGTLVLLHADAGESPLWEALRHAMTHRQRRPRLIITSLHAPSVPVPWARIAIPPLRERRSDIPLFIQARHPTVQWTRSAVSMLEAYPWPGNIAECLHILDRAVALAQGAPIDPAHLPPAVQHGTDDGNLPSDTLNLETIEIALIRQALERAHGNKTRAADLLGITRHTLLYRLEKYGLETRDVSDEESR